MGADIFSVRSIFQLISAPDRLNTSLLQSGSENQRVFFSGISGVMSGVYESMHYSLTSSLSDCYEQYQTTISNINERINTTILTSGCTYDLEVWAQCGDVRGPSIAFPVYVPGSHSDLRSINLYYNNINAQSCNSSKIKLSLSSFEKNRCQLQTKK